MGFPRPKGVLNILNWSCSLVTAHRRHPVSLAFVKPASFGGICCPDAPTFFSCSVLCALGWASSVICLPFLNSVLFSASGVDESQTMLVFGASFLAAAVNTLNGGVFKRKRCLTAIPGLHLVQCSARSPCKTVQYQLRQLLPLQKKTFSSFKSSSGMTPLKIQLHLLPQISTTQ